MEWEVMLVLAVAIVTILFPVAYVWGLTIGGIYAAIKRKGVATWVRIALPIGIYILAMAFLLGGYGWEVALGVTVAIPIIAIPIAFIWYLNVAGVLARVTARALAPIGRAIRIAVPIVPPIAIFVSLFFLAGLGWEVALGVTLAIPIFFVPVALIWYFNASGLFQVIADARRRQRRRAEALKLREAGALVRAR